MDLVMPLPKSAWGHQHILILLDYATWYPETYPLGDMSSKVIVACYCGYGFLPKVHLYEPIMRGKR